MIARSIAALVVLAASGVTCAGDDPEPPGKPLRKLQGAWEVRAVLVQGKERNSGGTYTFDKDKVTITPGSKGPRREMTVVPDKARKDLIEMKPDGGRAVRYFFKFEKGELYLVPVRPTDAKPEPDFSGDNAPSSS